MFTEEQKQMWNETNNTLNALFAVGLDIKTLLRLLKVTPDNVSEDVRETIKRLGNSVRRIQECQSNLQKMITKEGE